MVSNCTITGFYKQKFCKEIEMEIPKYLIDALYQFSQDVIDEHDHFFELKKQAAEDALEQEKHKETG
jgi:hypothetical protein